MNPKLVQKDNPVLRKDAQAVAIADIQSEEIQAVIKEMKETLFTQDDGVAIAAPQIGYSLRIFVISRKMFTDDPAAGIDKDVAFINPVITRTSRKMEPMEEGCLSVRWWYGKVMRHTKATITAFDEEGRKFSLGGSGLLAQIFQHETDHLNGILFLDKAKELQEIFPSEETK